MGLSMVGVTDAPLFVAFRMFCAARETLLSAGDCQCSMGLCEGGRDRCAIVCGVFECSVRRAGRCEAQELANAAWAFGKADVCDAQLFAALAQISEFGAAGQSNAALFAALAGAAPL